MKFLKQSLSLILSGCLMLATAPAGLADQPDQSTAPMPVQSANETPEQLQELVAPIALYPDALVAQILAASTYPAEIVEADRWVQQHTDLKGKQLAQEVNQQTWDPSVKALTEFPSVLANMDKNLSWTSSLGDAYINQQQDLMNAVQVMRQRAENAGNLNSTPQETVSTQGQTIVIQPAEPQVVYVPQYDPWLVYGAPLAVWPGWYPYSGLYLGGPGIAFGIGFGVGFFGGFGWGWHHWGFNWHNRAVVFNHNVYVSHSGTFVDRNYYNNRARENFNHAGGFHAGAGGFPRNSGVHGFAAPQHRFVPPHAQPPAHTSAFTGFDHGGVTRGFSQSGRSSFGGGFHGGGGHGGGGHR